MKRFVVLAALFGFSFAAICEHNNSDNSTEEHVIKLVATSLDTDSDGVITEMDIVQYFIIYFNFGNMEVKEPQFVKHWNEAYRDSEAFAQHVFHSFDTNDDGLLNSLDIDYLDERVDTSGDDQVQISEFEKYLSDIYNAC